MNGLKVSVVILNWNGKKWLDQFLPSVVLNSNDAEIVLADNNSSDDSVQFVKSNFPSVKIVLNDKNYGFAEGYNQALNKIDSDIYVLLNSDVEVSKNWLNPLVEWMTNHPETGACMPKILDYNNKSQFEYAGACGGYIDYLGYPFCRGRIFNTLENDAQQYNKPEEIFWATGACMVVRSKIYHELGGFDPYFFAHMEEIDLCWRIKNCGYKIHVIPDSFVYHVGGGTLNKISPQKTYLNFRNNLITYLKNAPSEGLIFNIFLRLILDGIAGIKFLFEGQATHTFSVLKAHFSFYKQLGDSLEKRKKLRTSKSFNQSRTAVYNKSIVAEYYLRSKKVFSELISFGDKQ